MLSTSDFRKGMKLGLDSDLYVIVDFQHARTAQRRANVWTKLKNLKTGRVLERTFSAGETFQEPEFTERMMQYLYNDSEAFNFMDGNSVLLAFVAVAFVPVEPRKFHAAPVSSK